MKTTKAADKGCQLGEAVFQKELPHWVTKRLTHQVPESEFPAGRNSDGEKPTDSPKLRPMLSRGWISPPGTLRGRNGQVRTRRGVTRDRWCGRDFTDLLLRYH